MRQSKARGWHWPSSDKVGALPQRHGRMSKGTQDLEPGSPIREKRRSPRGAFCMVLPYFKHRSPYNSYRNKNGGTDRIEGT